MTMNLQRIKEFLYMIFVFILPVFFWNEPGKTALYVYPKIILLNGFTFVFISIKIFELFKLKKKVPAKFYFSILDCSLLLFLVYQIISLFWSINYHLGIEYLSLLFSVGIFYFLFKNENFSRSFLFKMFLSIQVASVVVCLYGIVQLSGIDFINQPHQFQNIVVSSLGNKNFLSQFLIFSIWVHFFLFTYKKDRKYTFFFIVSLFLNIFTLLATLSKTGIIALGILIILSIAALITAFRGRIPWKKLFLSLTSVLVVLAVFYSLSIFVPSRVETDKYYIAFGYSIKHKGIVFDERQNFQAAIHNQVLLVYYKILELRSLENEQVRIRYLLIKNSLQLIKKYWIKGVGINQWQIHYQKYLTLEEKKIVDHLSGEGGTALKAHNEWIQIFSELGLIGLILFLSIIVFLVRSCFVYKEEKNTIRSRMRKGLFFVYILTFLIEAFTSFVFHNIVPLCSIFLLIAIIDTGKGREIKKRYLTVFLLVVLGIGNIFLIKYNYLYARKNYFNIIAGMYRYHGQLKNAEIGYRNALHYDPNDYQTYFHLGAIYIAMADHFKNNNNNAQFVKHSYLAKENWNKVIELHPYLSRAYYNLGNISYDLAEYSGRNKDQFYKEAAEYYEQAIAIFPEYTNAYVNLGNVYATLGIFILDAKTKEEAVKFFGQDKGTFFYQKSMEEKNEMAREAFLLALKKHEKAYDLFHGEYASVADPTILKSLGIDYHYLKDYKKAVEYFQEYLKRNPNAPDKDEIEETILEDSEKLNEN